MLRHPTHSVTPAKAGASVTFLNGGSRFRGNDPVGNRN